MPATQWTRYFWLSLALAISPAAQTQTVIPADLATVQPLVYRDGATINGCGVRVIVLSGASDAEALVADFSITLNIDIEKNSPWGLLKAGLYRGAVAAGPDKLKTMPIVSFFVTNEDGSVSAVPTKLVPAENSGFLLGGAEPATATTLLTAIEDGTRLQIGLRPKGESITRIFSFNAQWKDVDRASHAGCMAGLMRTLDATLKRLESRSGTEPAPRR